MPRYDFRCHDCTTVFEVERPMSRAAAPVACPQCGSGQTYKLLSQVAFVSGNQRTANAPLQTTGCACGGSCACGGH